MSINTETQVLTDIILAIFRINGALLENGDKRVAPFDLSSAQWQVLAVIGLNESPMTTPQIAKFIGISRQAVQKQLSGLLTSELIISHPNPYHERSPLYSVSEQGALKHQGITQIYEQYCQKLASPFTASELTNTLKVLQGFYEGLLLEGTLLDKHLD